jgi:hypothetical protein
MFPEIVKIVKQPSFILIAGYLAGQGSALLLQGSTKLMGYDELVGIFVLVISLYSFGFQFSDIGNSTYLVKKSTEFNKADILGYLRVRSLTALIICIIFSIFSFYSSDFVIHELYPFFILAPLSGCLAASYRTAILEAESNYLLMAIHNAIPWLALSLLLSLTVFFSIDRLFELSVVIGIAIIFVVYVNGILIKSKAEISEGAVYRNKIIRVFQFVAPQLGGQVWGRVILFHVATNIGLSALGVFGLIKYIQVFLTLMIGFVTRPKLRNYIDKCLSESLAPSFEDLILEYKIGLLLAFIGPVIYLFSLAPLFSNTGSNWFLILCAIPFVFLSQTCIQINQLTLKPALQVIGSYIGLLLNMAGFFMLLNSGQDYPEAILAGEVLQCASNITFYFLIKINSNNRLLL